MIQLVPFHVCLLHFFCVPLLSSNLPYAPPLAEVDGLQMIQQTNYKAESIHVYIK